MHNFFTKPWANATRVFVILAALASSSGCAGKSVSQAATAFDETMTTYVNATQKRIIQAREYKASAILLNDTDKSYYLLIAKGGSCEQADTLNDCFFQKTTLSEPIAITPIAFDPEGYLLSKALLKLAAYSKAVKTLATTEYTSSVQTNMDTINTSLTNIAKLPLFKDVKINMDQFAASTSLAKTLVKLTVEEMQREALSQILPKGQQVLKECSPYLLASQKKQQTYFVQGRLSIINNHSSSFRAESAKHTPQQRYESAKRLCDDLDDLRNQVLAIEEENHLFEKVINSHQLLLQAAQE